MEHEALCEALLDYLSGVLIAEISRDSRLLEEELLDSFDKVGVIGFLEQTLDIQVAPEQVTDAPFANLDSIASWALSLTPPA